MRRIENIGYITETDRERVLDIYLPDSDKFPVLVFFHGGGLEAGSKNDDVFYEELQKKGIAVVTANYRMYPQASYPQFIEDAAAATAWAYRHMSAYGTVTGYFVGGSSAGAYLAQMLCFDKHYLAAYGIDSDAVDGYLFGAGQPTTHFRVLTERGLDSRRVIIDEAAPLYHIGEGRSYPPMQIIVSDHDMQNRSEQTKLMLSTLKHFGVKEDSVDFRWMEDSEHCDYMFRRDAAGQTLFTAMAYDFITRFNRKE